MKILKQRKAAIAITVAVIILATFFGAHRSLTAEAKKVEEMFYIGVSGPPLSKAYTETAIAEHLAVITDAALGIETVAANYDGLKAAASDMTVWRRELAEAKSITDKYMAFHELEGVYDALTASTAGQQLSEPDAKVFTEYSDRFNGARAAIGNSAYNVVVAGFERSTDRFPAGILKSITFVNEPEYFGLEG